MAKILIIGASSSMGMATSESLKNAGFEVIHTARDNSKIEPDYILDATNFEDTEKVFEEIGDIDGVICFSGSLLLKPAHLTSYEEYKDTIDKSLTATFSVTRAAGKYMKSGGSIVFISSAASLGGFANHEAIAAAKGGINSLILSAAATYAKQFLRFNAIAPGLVDTNLTKPLTSNETSRKVSESMHALGRIGDVNDIARAALFLLNPENNWITGQVIGIDGGLSIIRPKMKV